MKIFSFSLILFLCTGMLQAQYSDFPKRSFDMPSIDFEKVQFGIKINPSISWLDVKHNDVVQGGASLKLGVGITANYEINSILSALIALNYSNLGGYVSDSKNFADVNAKDYYKINYKAVELPVGLKLKTPVINKHYYYLLAGVNTSFLTGATETYYSAVNAKKMREENILTEYTHPTVVGYFGGLGAGFELSSKLSLFMDVQYKNMISTISIGDNYIRDARYTEPLYLLPRNMEFSIGLEF